MFDLTMLEAVFANLSGAPVLTVFIIIVLGYFLGKIKLFNVSMDLSAILITALGFGAFMTCFTGGGLSDTFRLGMSMLSKLGTGVFVASIGVSTGYSASKSFNKHNLIYLLTGVLMVMVGFIVMELIYIYSIIP